jgi:phosphoribosylglycinamide formyltransferase-1
MGVKECMEEYVHEAVLANKEKETGITIHLVNEEFDKGEVIAQYTCCIDS